MKTELLYFENKNLIDNSLNDLSQIIRDVFSGSDKLTYTPCSAENFNKLYKKAVKANDLVFIANHHTDTDIQYSIKDKYFDDTYMFFVDEELYAFVGESKKTIVASVTLGKDNLPIISYIVGKYLIKDHFDFFSHRQLIVSKYNAEVVHELLAGYCNMNNPRIYITEDVICTKINIFAGEHSREAADNLCDEVALNFKMLLGDNAYIVKNTSIENIVVESLIVNGLTLATAESCTAGLLSSAITSVPNSSSVFEIGISSYSNRIKRAALGVSKSAIDNFGAVSMETASEMATGILNLSNSDLGLSITGVAGPGCSEVKPVGTVYIALSNGEYIWVVKNQFDPSLSRNEIRRKSVYEALDLVRRYLECLPSLLPCGTKVGEPLNLLNSQPHYIGNSIEYSENMIHNRVIHENDTVDGGDDIFSSISAGYTAPIITSNIDSDDAVPEAHENDFEQFITTPIDELGENEEPEIPNKENKFRFTFDANKIKKLASIAVFAVIIAAILGGSAFAITYFTAKSANDKSIANARELWEFYDDRNNFGAFEAFDDIRALNTDIKGWIKIGDTQINNPICMTSDNEFYAKHNYLLKRTRYGSLFFDYRSKADSPRVNQNLVIYGNNMNDGSMFGSLSKYLNSGYISKNSTIELTTLYNNRQYSIFSVMIVAEAKDDNGA
ncbi:MAG: nicotinamide-nucleotide amidohydrolase family protein, partial [Clostridia bacterium]|nr:nicotinamide-nucleotide amidohydrolase family protein [Clostridia bacterium]